MGEDKRVGPVVLPPNFVACERGNVLLVYGDGGDGFDSWVRVGGTTWLGISWRPQNYPAMHVGTSEFTDAELWDHIKATCGGMLIRKMGLSVKDPAIRLKYVPDDDNDPDDGGGPK